MTTGSQQISLWEEIAKAGPRTTFSLDRFDVDQVQSDFYRRKAFREKFGFAVPTPEIISRLVTFIGQDKCLEVGAGRGLWAKLLQNERVFVTPTDFFAHGTNITLGNTYFKGGPTYTNIVRMDAEVAVQTFRDHNVLMLIWPPYAEAMAAIALEIFEGTKIIYIGEGEGGATGDDAFHDLLDKQWKLVQEIVIPTWACLHDRLFLYERITS